MWCSVELRVLVATALQLVEVRVAREQHRAVPDPTGVVTAGDAGQDRTEERDVVDVDGRGADVVTDEARVYSPMGGEASTTVTCANVPSESDPSVQVTGPEPVQAPAVGAAVAAELLGEEPPFDLSHHRPERFAGGAVFPETLIL